MRGSHSVPPVAFPRVVSLARTHMKGIVDVWCPWERAFLVVVFRAQTRRKGIANQCFVVQKFRVQPVLGRPEIRLCVDPLQKSPCALMVQPPVHLK